MMRQVSISEKMRSQIRGLDKASSNAQDGISLIQVAEGALNESHSILQRMNELTQAANDTTTSSDRKSIQQELTQLTSELDRIYSTTQFNANESVRWKLFKEEPSDWLSFRTGYFCFNR